MKKMFALLAMLLIISIQVANAQKRTISGRITAKDDGKSIPGVNVSVVGTTTGTVTDIDGKYQISVPDGKNKITFSFIGMKKQELTLTESNSLDVVLESDITKMNEVVVTALGISKEKRSIGYSSQEVNGNDLIQAKEANIINSLSGKVSGIQITNSSGAVGASSRIVIRGASSLGGNNQPLFIVDGVAISNSEFGKADGYGGSSRGNGIGDINPEDVENVTVL
jgi:hypothetical protein